MIIQVRSRFYHAYNTRDSRSGESAYFNYWELLADTLLKSRLITLTQWNKLWLAYDHAEILE